MTRIDIGLVVAGSLIPSTLLAYDQPWYHLYLLPALAFCFWTAFSRPKRRYSR